MKLFKTRTNMSNLQKICLAGLFTALVTILQKVLAVNYLPGFLFIRFSFGGPGLIIFSSILLGPFYGLLIGTASDILGYFVFDMSGAGWWPQVTLTYALLGFFSYFVFWGIKGIKNKKVIMIIETVCFVALIAFVAFYLFKIADVDTWVKIVIPWSIAILIIGLSIFVFIFDKKVKLKVGYNVFQISLCSFILELIILLGFGTVMKAWAFGWESFLVILAAQSVVMFFNIVVDTIVISLLLNATKKYFINEN